MAGAVGLVVDTDDTALDDELDALVHAPDAVVDVEAGDRGDLRLGADDFLALEARDYARRRRLVFGDGSQSWFRHVLAPSDHGRGGCVHRRGRPTRCRTWT